jgi:hypothetical protein
LLRKSAAALAERHGPRRSGTKRLAKVAARD